MFPLFYKQVAWKLAHKLIVIFRHLDKGDCFPACWKLADVVPLPKGSSFSNVGDYRPISITSILPEVFEKVVTGKLSHYLGSNSLLPPSQFSYRRALGTCDALLTLSHHLQAALDRGMEGRLVQLDVSATFDRVNHCCIS